MSGVNTRDPRAVLSGVTIFLTELRHGARSTLKTPGFAAATVLTLAMGMTLCTTAMAVFTAYLLNGLPYPAADRLYSIRYAASGQTTPRDMERLDWPLLEDVIEHPLAWDLDVFFLLGGEHTEAIPGAWVTPGFVAGLGITPAIGPGFDVDSFAPGNTNTALISHRLWTSRFAADPAIVGRTFSAYVSDRPEETESFTIAGVLPAGFWHINPYTDILAPLRAPTYPYMVRLKPGVTPESAAARITALVRSGARDVPQNWSAELISTHEGYVRTVRPTLRAVTTASAVVLLVACANVAGLLLIRASRRRKEIAVRAALGASRSAIARVLIAEGLLIGTAAAGLSLWLTSLALRWLGSLVQQQLGRPAPGGTAAFAVDAQIVLFALLTGIATALLCTLAPLVTSVASVQNALQSGGRNVTEGRRSLRTRSALIAVEIAASLALLAGTTLMLRSVIGMWRADLGVNAEGVLNAGVTLRQNRYPNPASRGAVFKRIVSRLSEVPGAESVGLTSAWPMQQPQLQPVEIEGGPPSTATRAAVHAVSAGYFSSLHIRIVSGRTFEDGARSNVEGTALVSETLARRLWPAGDAVGNRLIVPQQQERGEPLAVSRTIVGIVADVRQGPADEELADVYVSIMDSPSRFAFVMMRTAGSAVAGIPGFRSAFRDVDPEISVHRAGPLQAHVDELTARPRFLAALLAGFAAISALVALVGIYGVIAYAVKQREREVAVRMALGASPARLTRQFMRQGGSILIVGIVLGLAGAVAGGRLIESQLFGVTARDPVALTAAASGFAAIGLLAVWWPSRRAAATDPAIALRAE